MAVYRDSVGNTYDTLPAKKAGKGSKGAKPGPKHGRKSKYAGTQKKHGINTGRNGASSRKRYFGEPKPREAALNALFWAQR